MSCGAVAVHSPRFLVPRLYPPALVRVVAVSDLNSTCSHVGAGRAARSRVVSVCLCCGAVTRAVQSRARTCHRVPPVAASQCHPIGRSAAIRSSARQVGLKAQATVSLGWRRIATTRPPGSACRALPPGLCSVRARWCRRCCCGEVRRHLAEPEIHRDQRRYGRREAAAAVHRDGHERWRDTRHEGNQGTLPEARVRYHCLSESLSAVRVLTEALCLSHIPAPATACPTLPCRRPSTAWTRT